MHDDELEQLIADAARNRAEGMAARADRPRRRRAAEAQTARAWVDARARCEVRAASAGSDLLHFTGYASVYETPYEMWDFWGPYTEVVAAGAGEHSLNRADLDVPLVLQHSSIRRIARTTNGTLTLREDDHGLLVDAPALDPRDQDVAYITPKLEAGLIDEMSFQFMIGRGQWSPDFTQYTIAEYEIHRGDTAIVGYGANPWTAGAGLRAQAPNPLEVVRGLDDTAAREALAILRGRLEPPTPTRGTPIEVVSLLPLA